MLIRTSFGTSDVINTDVINTNDALNTIDTSLGTFRHRRDGRVVYSFCHLQLPETVVGVGTEVCHKNRRTSDIIVSTANT